MPTKNQPTSKPTRKIAAVIISGAITGGLATAASMLMPGTDLSAIIAELDQIIIALIMAASGYFVRENK